MSLDRTNLPAQPTPLIGRDAVIEEICDRLRDPAIRLLTLTGVGGSGKTRLALAAAERLVPVLPDGVSFVDLAPLRDPALVAGAVAQALDLSESDDRPTRDLLIHGLRERSALLLLDNFEHLLPAASLVADLLAACPTVKMLVTSRAPLRLRWEYELPVPPLSLRPATNGARCSDAAALFIERVSTVRPEAGLTAESLATVEEICRRLDGLPLAIELAAARGRLLAPDAILARLDRRLPLLTGGARDAPARQQTLRDAIAWSYDLLRPEEQRLFRLTAVFTGGWAIDTLAAVGMGWPSAEDSVSAAAAEGAVLDTLAESSLIVQDAGPDGPRFATLETVREYALERLLDSGDANPARERHAQTFLRLAEQAESRLRGSEQLAWIARLEREHDNLRAALRWCIDTGGAQSEVALKLAARLEWFWQLQSHYSEGRRWLAEALALPDAPRYPAARAWALYAAGSLARFHDDHAAAQPLLEESVAALREVGDRRGLAYGLHWLAMTISQRGNPDAASTLLLSSIDIFRVLDDPWGLAMALASGSGMLRYLQRPVEAQAWAEESVVIARRLGDRWNLARSINYRSQQAEARGDGAAAISDREEAHAIGRELGHRRLLLANGDRLFELCRASGHVSRAAALLGESLALYAEVGSEVGLAVCLARCGDLALDRRDVLRAAHFFGAAAARDRSSGPWWGEIGRPPFSDAFSAMLDTAGAAHDAAATWREGYDRPLREAVAEAIAYVATIAAHEPSPTSTTHERVPAHDLTAREVEVLRLLAAGKSNRGIADALVLSVRTAERHIANLYEKIGAHDKTARATATAYAFRHDLVPPT